jgi:hypothetical protein
MKEILKEIALGILVILLLVVVFLYVTSYSPQMEGP